jgi:16S rRNA (uracil1498-N3)-methyltransferase
MNTGKKGKMRRIYLDKNECVREDNIIYMKGEVFHYLNKVLRMKAGDKFEAFDGTGSEYVIRIKGKDTESFAGIIEAEKKDYNRELPFEFILFQSIPKGSKMDFIVRETAQLGVTKIVPVSSTRVVPVFDRQKANKKAERWRKIAIEAAKIAGRTLIPEVTAPVKFQDACGTKTDFSFIFWEDGKKSLKNFMKRISSLPDKKFSVKIFVGPEGGYTKEEVVFASGKAIVPVSLGKRILKVETASVIATAITIYELENKTA